MAIIPFFKRYGETLDRMLNRFRKEQSFYTESKITYAGRLDPMAEGTMLLLTDEDVHAKDDYLKLDKVYQVEFILGAMTDSYDILGEITSYADAFDIPIAKVEESIANSVGQHEQNYPPFSSKTVSGKPLWQWSREGSIDEIVLPSQEIEVKEAQYLGFNSYSEDNLSTRIQTSLSLVHGDFRQEETSMAWQQFFREHSGRYRVFEASFHVSSGTYIRSLIHDIGQQLGVGAVCLKITRKRVGEYEV
ncbi:MAG: hypothetical protein MRY57_00180 [Candidatus Pacebacteria bacterium]|nr:hypothetical protein [Candidatus Paceibacterota bacterium]